MCIRDRGAREAESGLLTIRHSNGTQEADLSVEALIEKSKTLLPF